jgi:hypothetical protein
LLKKLATGKSDGEMLEWVQAIPRPCALHGQSRPGLL